MTGRYCSLAQQSAPAFTPGLTAERGQSRRVSWVGTEGQRDVVRECFEERLYSAWGPGETAVMCW